MFSYLGDARVVIGASIGIIKSAPSPLRSTIIGEISFLFRHGAVCASIQFSKLAQTCPYSWVTEGTRFARRATTLSTRQLRLIFH